MFFNFQPWFQDLFSGYLLIWPASRHMARAKPRTHCVMAGAKPSTALRNCKTFPENCSPPWCVKTPRNKVVWFCRLLVIRWWYWDWSSQRTCKFVMVKLCSFVRFPFFGQAVASNSHETSTFRMNQFPLHFRPLFDAWPLHLRPIFDQFSMQGRLAFDSISTLFRLTSDECPTQFRLFFDQLTLDELRRILD